MTVLGLLVPPACEDSSTARKTYQVNEKKTNTDVGLVLTADVVIIRISEDVPLRDHYVSPQNGIYGACPVCYSLAVKCPIVEMFVKPPGMIYFGVHSQDFSLFEMSLLQCESGGGGDWCRGVKCGEGAYEIPFLHRTTLNQAWNNSSSNLPFAFSFQVMIENEVIEKNILLSPKRVSVHITLQDVTLRYDPMSVWFLKMINLLTPPSEESLSPINKQSINMDSNYGVTYVNIYLYKFMIDYCCCTGTQINGKFPPDSSRLLFSVGLFTLSTNIVSNVKKNVVKILVRDVALNISNRLLLNSMLEQTPLDITGFRSSVRAKEAASLSLDIFKDSHGFVSLGALNYATMSIVAGDDSGADFSVSCEFRDFVFAACWDSLGVLAVSICYFLHGFPNM